MPCFPPWSPKPYWVHSTLSSRADLSRMPPTSACFAPKPFHDPLPALQALYLPSAALLSHPPFRRKASCQVPALHPCCHRDNPLNTGAARHKAKPVAVLWTVHFPSYLLPASPPSSFLSFAISRPQLNGLQKKMYLYKLNALRVSVVYSLQPFHDQVYLLRLTTEGLKSANGKDVFVIWPHSY